MESYSHSFGDTGTPYSAYNPYLKYPVPVELEVGKEYLMAVHFVDYETTFTQRELRLKPIYLKDFLNLTGPDYDEFVTRDRRSAYVFGAMTISISFLLFFLFWLLVFLNPGQSIFKWIAWMTTFTLLAAIGSFFQFFNELSYTEEKIRFVIAISLQPISTIFGLLILEWLLTSRVSTFVKSLVVAILATNLLAHLFSISWPFGVAFFTMIGYYIYLIVQNKNRIKGSLWAVVAAMVFQVVVASLYITVHKYSLDLFNEYDKLMTSMLQLGTPLLLLGFISIRFRETLDSVKKEANKVLQVTKEKKELLQNQNLILEQQVETRTKELKDSIEELKATQEQLIQQEKLASLGQLTAGIAHEIKNPLNFVNNFSELSVELVEEIKEELSAVSDQLSAEDKEKVKEALEILGDIEMNLRKIHEHGSRADSIVKSMLEHSRGASGKMEPTDLNALVKEFVNLSFHGMRASKNPINVDMEFELDDSIGDVPLIAEDFSRVIINLCNNAFDAMREKEIQNEEFKMQNYSPKLTVRTFKKNQATFIEIEDNGPGIPENIREKILQPFFTTKKGTEGTGLGLSITNDIIKAHGGFLEVSTNQHEGTCLTIKLSPGG